ncbi:hypothetical protein ACE1TI_06575 [Alteribacillus sp. JSM 102045]
MKEKVGSCYICGKEILCLNGFLNGVVDECKHLFCFDCAEEKDDQEE